MGSAGVRTGVAVAIAVVGIGLAVLTVVRLSSSNHPTSARGSTAAAHKAYTLPAPPDIVPGKQSQSEIAERLSGAVSVRLKALAAQAGADLPEAAALAEDAGQVVAMYLSGDADDYVAYLRARGDPLPTDRWEDEATRAEFWKVSSQSVAQVLSTDVAVKREYLEGKHTDTWVGGSHMSSAWRFDKVSGVREAVPDEQRMAKYGLDVYEVLVPARLRTHSGTTFDGHLGLSYAWDSDARRWVLVKVSIHDVPPDAGVILPPL